MVDLVERIDVMLDQEIRFYKTRDYLAPEFQEKLASVCDAEHILCPISTARTSVSSSSSSSSSSGINEVWREKICEWSYQVIDHFDFSREVVSISMHYLDRYLATRPVNKKVFQLAAMTSLFIAIKLYEPGKLSMPSMIELSRGYFGVEQMKAMEISILRSLYWRVHPPTAYCFAKHALMLLPQNAVPMDIRHDLLELARFLTELSVIDYFFVIHRPSTVATASILNAMEEVLGATHSASSEFLKKINRIDNLVTSGPELEDCRSRLRLLYAQGGYARPTPATELRDETISPVCVSYGCTTTSTLLQDPDILSSDRTY